MTTIISLGSFTPKEDQCGVWDSPPNSKCPSSFGDQGTTASVGAFGQLLQFSNYLGAGTSGMFSADHPDTVSPYLVVYRIRQLHSLAQEPSQFHSEPGIFHPFGLDFPSLQLQPDVQPQLKWVNWRWPRYEYETGAFQGDAEQLKVTNQWFIHDKVVLQRCVLNNRGPNNLKVDLAFCKRMKIRDLDHLTNDFDSEYFQSEKDYDMRPGPKGYSWTCVRKFREASRAAGQTADDIVVGQGQQGQPESPSDGGQRERIKKVKPYGAAVVVAMMINGNVETFEGGTDPQRWTHFLKSGAGSKEDGGGPHVMEVTTAYKMILIGTEQSGWDQMVITAEEMNIDYFLRNELASLSISLFTAVKEDQAEKKDTREGHPPRSSTNNLKMGRSQDAHKEGDEMYTPLPSLEFPRGVPVNSSAKRHIEFMVWRNLEHILSVCAVPITVSLAETKEEDTKELNLDWDKIEPIALTCGDMSGHRVCTSAS